MSGAPDRCAAPLAASATEIGLQAGAATLPAISVREAGVGGDETIPARFEPIKLATGCENVVSEDGDVAQRPCEQLGDDLFREPRLAVLPAIPLARDSGGRLSCPALYLNPSPRLVVTFLFYICYFFLYVFHVYWSPCLIFSIFPFFF